MAWALKNEVKLSHQTPQEAYEQVEARHYRLTDALLRYALEVLPDGFRYLR
ncbi:MAG: hypothetical protein M1492_12285 [Gammaproteobacteria bacterium]|nr:hypothetical protein [Gammaproteobacteria bacterium]